MDYSVFPVNPYFTVNPQIKLLGTFLNIEYNARIIIIIADFARIFTVANLATRGKNIKEKFIF